MVIVDRIAPFVKLTSFYYTHIGYNGRYPLHVLDRRWWDYRIGELCVIAKGRG